MLGKFDKQRLASLLDMARGNDSINEFGRLVGISGSYVSRLINCKVPKAPSADVLLKFSAEAKNGVTYEHFMIAAGHLPDPEDVYEQDKLNGNAKQIADIATPEQIKRFEELGYKVISVDDVDDQTIHDLEALLQILKKKKAEQK